MFLRNFFHSQSCKLSFAVLATIAAAAAQPFAYVGNSSGNNVTVVNRATNTVAATIGLSSAGVGGLAIMPNGSLPLCH